MDVRQSMGTAAAAAKSADSSRRASSPVDGLAQKSVGYGLPCSRCHLYYPADLNNCPGCGSGERVSPVPTKGPVPKSQASVQPVADLTALEQEREEFLRQFKSQLQEVQRDLQNEIAAEAECTLAEHPQGEDMQAIVCKSCYEKIQERVDVLEATLHMDVKEAAQIVYDAVWADPSDPNKTYQNAAGALLSELRKRSGTNSVHSPFQPLAH